VRDRLGAAAVHTGHRLTDVEPDTGTVRATFVDPGGTPAKLVVYRDGGADRSSR
jgi:2-polyprenyl-6-methoxyphenol hydroxylase-like FAD-dependent oxidoreductase